MGLRLECHDLAVAPDGAQMLPPTSFTLEAPGLVALTGANGAGKTTLLKTLAGRQLPTQGQCLINGQRPYEFDPGFRAAAASLIDAPPMARDMTLLEQLALVGASWGNDQFAVKAAQQLLARLTIPDLGERFPYELSAGQLQLFAAALTLSRPFDLLLDEPERHLDQQRVYALLDLMEEHSRGGALVITATHRAEVIERSQSRIDLSDGI